MPTTTRAVLLSALLSLPHQSHAKTHRPITDPQSPDQPSPPFINLLTSPPASLPKFLLSLLLLALLTYLGQKSLSTLSYWAGWVYRRLDGESGYEEGKKVSGWDSDGEDGGVEGEGEVVYAAEGEVGRILDYVVTVDDGVRREKEAGGVKKRKTGGRDGEEGWGRATASRGV